MITIGRQADYAARTVLYLAGLDEGTRVTASEIAGKRLIPPAFIRRIVSRLSAAGILDTVRGNKGGVSLAKKSSEISLREVIEAIEGPIVLNTCLTEEKACPLTDLCPVQAVWYSATQNLADYLDDVRFDGLAARIEGGRSERKRKTAPEAGKRRTGS